MIRLICLMCCVLFVMNSCTSKENKITKDEVNDIVYEYIYPIPTSYHLTEMLNEMGAEYIASLCNDVASYDKYLTEYNCALNLGVYSADICYVSTYIQQEETKNYLDVCYKLIDNLDIIYAVDSSLPDKIENNKDNKSVVINSISDSFYRLYDYLNKNDREYISLLIVYGSLLETMYIATNISECTFDNKTMVKIIMSQKDALNTIVDKFKDYDNVEAWNDMISLNEIYQNCNGESVTEIKFCELKEKIKEIRTKIVSYN